MLDSDLINSPRAVKQLIAKKDGDSTALPPAPAPVAAPQNRDLSSTALLSSPLGLLDSSRPFSPKKGFLASMMGIGGGGDTPNSNFGTPK